MITSQRLWPLDHEAGHLGKFLHKLKCSLENEVKMVQGVEEIRKEKL